ncbi:MAG: UMP kinase [Candidatus Edwardsbacteria bacterium]|nr:UMP kinase [Candidatus Edwardsbacteria bacterium]
MSPDPKYHRILLKLSGETMGGTQGRGLDIPAVERIADEVLSAKALGASVAIVIGGGNIVRGAAAQSSGIARVTADQMGMLATVINSLALQSSLENKGCQTRVMSAVEMPKFAEAYIWRRALRHLDKGRVVIVAAGTGNPYFSTDTAAALRAVEIGADALLKGTKVDGVYTGDPAKDPAATRYETLSYDRALADRLNVMDATAITLCRENKLPIVVFNLNQPGSLARVVRGEPGGTLIKE